jgi:chemotaxis protein histidine kinase CheA
MLPLSSLLLQRGVATLAEVEAALARQTEHGDDLATNLIEVTAVDEAKLVEVVSDCEGMRAAVSGPLPEPEPAALRAVPAPIASRVPFLPQRVAGDLLVVVVAEPMPPSMEHELSFALGLRFEQTMSLRSRVLQGLAFAYGLPLHRRHARIVARLDGRADPFPSVAPPPPVLQSLLPARLSHGPVAADPSLDPKGWSRPSSTPPQAPQNLPRMLGPQPRARRGPFELLAAREALDAANTNTEVIAVFFDFAKQFFEYTALFVVRDDLAEGLAAAGPGVSRERIRGIGVPLELPSILSRARDEKTHVLDVPTAEGIDAVLRQDLQRPMRARVLTVPLAVRGRVVALLYGDDGRADVDLNMVGDVLALVPLVGAALESLILRRKLEARTEASGESKPRDEPTPRRKRTTLTGLHALAADASQVALPPVVVPSADAGPRRPTTSPGVPAFDVAVSPAAASVRWQPAAESERRDTDAPLVSPVAQSVRSHSETTGPELDLPSPGTLIGLGPEGRSGSVWDVDAEGTPPSESPWNAQDIPDSIASAPTLLSIGTEQEQPPQELAAEQELPEQEPAAEQEQPEQEPAAEQEQPEQEQPPQELAAEQERPQQEPAAEQERPQQEPAAEQEQPVAEQGEESEPSSGRGEPAFEREQEPVAARQESDEKESSEEEGPVLSVKESDEDDEMMEAVLAELQRSPAPEPVEDSPSAHVVVQEPREPPKSSSPADMGLPLVILNIGSEIDDLLDRLEAKGTTEKEAEGIRAELRSFGQGWIEPVLGRFPGRTTEVADLTTGELPAVSGHGALLRFVVEQGNVIARSLLERTSHPDPEVRVWLVLTLAEIGGKEAREAVSQALFDFDGRVRSAARLVLRSVVGLRAWANGVRSLVRRAAAEEDQPERRVLAVQALGEIREVSSVPILMDALGADEPDIRQAAEEGLRSVTRHAFGGDLDAWQTWWEKNFRRARYDWLVDALARDDEAQREAAHRELIEIVGEDLGYDANASEEARSEALKAYRKWWDDEARRSSKRKRKARET